VERDTILKTLEVAGGNKSETARRLGITRRTLHKKLKKYGAMP
jgi:two-component system response regulator HydG